MSCLIDAPFAYPTAAHEGFNLHVFAPVGLFTPPHNAGKIILPLALKAQEALKPDSHTKTAGGGKYLCGPLRFHLTFSRHTSETADFCDGV